jgi:hypothetical protein
LSRAKRLVERKARIGRMPASEKTNVRRMAVSSLRHELIRIRKKAKRQVLFPDEKARQEAIWEELARRKASVKIPKELLQGWKKVPGFTEA